MSILTSSLPCVTKSSNKRAVHHKNKTFWSLEGRYFELKRRLNSARNCLLLLGTRTYLFTDLHFFEINSRPFQGQSALLAWVRNNRQQSNCARWQGAPSEELNATYPHGRSFAVNNHYWRDRRSLFLWEEDKLEWKQDTWRGCKLWLSCISAVSQQIEIICVTSLSPL